MTEIFVTGGPTGLTGNNISANAQALNDMYGVTPPLPTTSFVAQAWRSLTGQLDGDDYELPMPWPQPPVTPPTYIQVSADESVLIAPTGLPGVAALAANASVQAEPIMEEDDMSQLTQEQVDEFGDRIAAFGGNDKLVVAISTIPKSGMVANAAQAKAYSDVMLLVNAAGGMDRFQELLAVYVTQQQDPSARMPLADTDERLRLIEQVLVNALAAGSGGVWSVDDLRRLPTGHLPKLAKMYADRIPRDYSANAGVVRQSGPENEEIPMHWPQWDQAPSQYQVTSPESRNNYLRRIVNGNGHK